MEYSPAVGPPQKHVRAVFRTSAAFFDMPRVATFGDLADRLCSLGERHAGPLTSINIQTDPLHESLYARAALLRQLTGGQDEDEVSKVTPP